MSQGPELLRRLLRAKDRMDGASHEEWSIRRLAHVSAVSASHFAHSFKEAFGVPHVTCLHAASSGPLRCFATPTYPLQRSRSRLAGQASAPLDESSVTSLTKTRGKLMPNLTQVRCVLAVNDLERSVEFYREKLGFIFQVSPALSSRNPPSTW